MSFLKKTRDIVFKKLSSLTNQVYTLNYIQLLAFFALAFVVFHIGHSIRWFVFSERDISRAVGWLEGHFFWPGPEMSGGNNLPGPFFYFLISPAFLMGENTYSQVALWTIIWMALTYTVAFSFIQKIISHRESLLICLITFISSRNIHNYSMLLNPEFAILFHVLAVIGLYYWREKRNSLYLYLTGLVIALGIQTHLLVALHTITVLLFYIIDKSERKKIKTLLLFLLLALSPILIYNILKYFHVFETSGRQYSDYINWLLKNIFSERWVNNIKELMFFVAPLSFCCGLILWQKYKTKGWLLKPSTKNLSIITAIPFLGAVIGARREWYLLFIPVFFIILISKWLDDLMPNNPNKRIMLLLVYSLFTMTSIFILNPEYIAPLDFYKSLFIKNKFTLISALFAFFAIFITSLQQHKKLLYKLLLFCFYIILFFQVTASNIYPIPYKPKQSFSTIWPTYKELYPIMKRIYLETNWPPKTAMKKIFHIRTAPHTSSLSLYTLTVESLNKSHTFFSRLSIIEKDNLETKRMFEKNKPQGYFIIQHLKKFTGWTNKDWQSYLSQPSLIAPILRQEITEDKIVIQKPTLYDSFWLIPYKTTENSLLPEGFHNTGQPYYWEEPEWLKQCNQVEIFKNETGFFYCRILPGHLQRAGLSMKFTENSYNNIKHFLSVQFFGISLGTALPSTNLDGSGMWSNIQLYLDCNKKSFHWKLPDIGYHKWDAYKSPEKMAKILLTPLKLRLPVSDCKKSDITKIKLTFTDNHTYQEEYKKETIIWELN